MKRECLSILPNIGEVHIAQIEVKKGEGILFDSYNASRNGFPTTLIYASSYSDLNQELKLWSERKYQDIDPKRKYLWVITENKLHIALESTPNPSSNRGYICHTNITGNGVARLGGEMWFLKTENDYKLFYNFKSGRYPSNNIEQHKIYVESLLKCLGYNEVEFLDT